GEIRQRVPLHLLIANLPSGGERGRESSSRSLEITQVDLHQRNIGGRSRHPCGIVMPLCGDDRGVEIRKRISEAPFLPREKAQGVEGSRHLRVETDSAFHFQRCVALLSRCFEVSQVI